MKRKLRPLTILIQHVLSTDISDSRRYVDNEDFSTQANNKEIRSLIPEYYNKQRKKETSTRRLPSCRCTEATLLKTIKLYVGISMHHNSVDKFDQK